MSLAFVAPALYKIPKTLLPTHLKFTSCTSLHTTNVHRCRNRKWYRIRWTDGPWWSPWTYCMCCSSVRGEKWSWNEKNERVQNLMVISLPIFLSMDFWKYIKLTSDNVSRGVISPVTPFVVGVGDRLIVEIVVHKCSH
jgi:hypothetical protein